MLRIYQNDTEGTELMVQGKIDSTSRSGASIKDLPFVGRIEIEEGNGTTKAKLRFFQGFVRGAMVVDKTSG